MQIDRYLLFLIKLCIKCKTLAVQHNRIKDLNILKLRSLTLTKYQGNWDQIIKSPLKFVLHALQHTQVTTQNHWAYSSYQLVLVMMPDYFFFDLNEGQGHGVFN